MDTLTGTTDARGRIHLPAPFANATVLIEQVSETELRIRKIDPTQTELVTFAEEQLRPLSDRDRDRFLDLLDNPPEPNEALKQAVAEFKTIEGLFGTGG